MLTYDNIELLDAIAETIREAKCPDREGPYGLYDYSIYSDDTVEFPHVVRDFRYPGTESYGMTVGRFSDDVSANEHFKQLTRHHIARSVLKVIDEFDVYVGDYHND